MNTYKVKSNLKHNGKRYSKGDEVDLTEDEATQLKGDNVVVELNGDVEDEERDGPQPGVNKVSRKDGDVSGERKVEPGQSDKTEDKEEAGDGEAVKKKYKVLKELEYPKGTIHKVDDVIELEDKEAVQFTKSGLFKKGVIERVKDETDNL